MSRSLLLLIVVLVELGCPFALSAADGPIPTKPKPRSAAGAGVTEAQARQFAEAMQKAAKAYDAKAFNALMDWTELVATGTSGMPDTPAAATDARNFSLGILSKIRDKGGLAEQIMNSTKEDGSYQFLRVHKIDNKFRVLFRLVSQQGLNYHDFVLEAKPNSEILAVDLYIYLTAELFSESIHRLYVPLAQGEQRGKKGKTAADDDFLKGFLRTEEFTEMVKKDRFDDAMKIYESLPQVLKQEKSILLQRLLVASRHDDASYAAAIAAYQAAFPNDPSLSLISIDGYILRGQFDKALEGTDGLDRQIGGDPYLNVIRANIKMSMKDYAGARRAAEKAIEDEPELVDAYWSLVTVALTEKNANEVLKQLKRIDEEFEASFSELADEPAYADFVKTPQYEEWKVYLKSKPAAAKDSK